jgi:hypothetical protein
LTTRLACGRGAPCREGIAMSRLRPELADGTRRRILWGHTSNSLPAIVAALRQTLGAPA